MSELLSTGEMIDELKVGQRAQSGTGDLVERTEQGIWDINRNDFVLCDEHFLEMRWEIKYLSFEEAIQALKEDEVVCFHPKKEQKILVYSDHRLDYLWLDYTWGELISGEWSIEYY